MRRSNSRRSTPWFRRRLVKALLIMVGLAVTAGLMLVAYYARPLWIIINSPIACDVENWGLISRGDPKLFWALKPNVKKVRLTGTSADTLFSSRHAAGFTVSTNELGLRNGPIREKGERFRILAVGDSTTFGDWVNDDETWPSQLQAILDPDADSIEVVNAGVSGYSAFQGLTYLEEFGLNLDPDMVLACFGRNSERTWDGISDYERAEAMASSAQVLVRLIRQRNKSQAEQTGARPRLTQQEFVKTLTKMKELCASRGVILILVAWPTKHDLLSADATYLRLVHETGTQTGTPVVDLAPVAYGDVNSFFDFIHFNAQGCRMVAETLAEYLTENGFLPQTG